MAKRALFSGAAAAVAETEETTMEDDGPPAALRNHVILSCILDQLDTKSLLNCSLVSRAWCKEARKVLQNHRQVSALIRGGNPCATLKIFDDTLMHNARFSPGPIPFTGIKVIVPYSDHPVCVGSASPTSLYPNILNRMVVKRLKIHWQADLFLSPPSCAGVELIQELLFAPELCQNLETCVIGELPSWLNVDTDDPSNQVSLPRLKELALWLPSLHQAFQNIPRENFLCGWSIMARAPNLQILRLDLSCAIKHTVTPDKYHCIVNLRFDPQTSEDVDWLEEVALSGVRLKKLQIGVCGILLLPEVNVNRCWRILDLLLEQGKHSLKVLQVDLAVAVKKFSTLEGTPGPTRVFPKLEFLSVEMPGDQIYVTLLGNINYAALFPNLKKVTLEEDRFIHAGDSLRHLCTEELALPRLNRSHEFRGELSVAMYTTHGLIAALANLFPAIRSFTRYFEWRNFTGGGGDQQFSTQIWEEYWRSLEELTLILGTHPAYHPAQEEGAEPFNPLNITFLNWDSFLCGISPEETQELQLKDDEFLRNLHIVSTKPAITWLKNLKRLRMVLQWRPDVGPHPVEPPEVFYLSKVAGWLAFKRMPALLVELFVPDRSPQSFTVNGSGFEHLEPFVKIKPYDDQAMRFL